MVAGLVTRGLTRLSGASRRKGSGLQVGLRGSGADWLQGSGQTVWSFRVVPKDTQGRKQRRALRDRRMSVGGARYWLRLSPGHGRSAGNDRSRLENGDSVRLAAKPGRILEVYSRPAERFDCATSIHWGRSTRERGVRGRTRTFQQGCSRREDALRHSAGWTERTEPHSGFERRSRF